MYHICCITFQPMTKREYEWSLGPDRRAETLGFQGVASKRKASRLAAAGATVWSAGGRTLNIGCFMYSYKIIIFEELVSKKLFHSFTTWGCRADGEHIRLCICLHTQLPPRACYGFRCFRRAYSLCQPRVKNVVRRSNPVFSNRGWRPANKR